MRLSGFASFMKFKKLKTLYRENKNLHLHKTKIFSLLSDHEAKTVFQILFLIFDEVIELNLGNVYAMYPSELPPLSFFSSYNTLLG